MENVIDKELYEKVKKEADDKFKRKTSAYKSMWISKTYQERGGKYKGEKKSLTKRWRDEEWVQVIPYITKGEKIACGDDNKENKVCRPLKRIDKDTPITISELRRKYTDDNILKLARKKVNDMDGRVYWKTGEFISSK
jgi:hypothetical protein